MAVYNSIINLPWSLKIFFGLVTDNIRICGLKRKPYLIFFGLVQTVVMFVLFQCEITSALSVTMLLFTASFSMAFSAVVIDAILVVQARRDPLLGSQDLFSVAFFFQGVAGVIGCIIAAFMMDQYHPKYAFLTYSIWGLVITICSFFLSREAEKEFNPGEVEIISHLSSELLSQ